MMPRSSRRRTRSIMAGAGRARPPAIGLVRAAKPDQDHRRDAPAERFGRDDGAIAADDAAILKTADPLDHGGAGKPDPFGERLHRQAAVGLKLAEDLLVDDIDMAHQP